MKMVGGYFTDEAESGELSGRKLSYTKKYEESVLRFTYFDTFRISGTEVRAAQWQIYCNGAPVSNLVFGKYKNTADNHNVHDPATLTGYITGYSPGTYTFSVRLEQVGTYPVSNSCTGWKGHWFMEVEEILLAD